MSTLLDLRTFGGLLADHRARLGWSQQELATRACLPLDTIQHYETSPRGEVDRLHVATLSVALGLAPVDQYRLYVSCHMLPPGDWVVISDWLVRPREDYDAV
jgi:transcriptional regulator with XRE-family HTH domain